MTKVVLVDNIQQSYSFEDLLDYFENTIKFESIKFKKRYKYINYAASDIEQELRIILYECFKKYNDNTIHFSTYFHTSIRNFMMNLVRRHTTLKRDDAAYEPSLNEELSDDNNCTLLDLVQGRFNTEDIVLARNIIKTLEITATTNLEKDIVKYFFNEMTVMQIANKFDISRRAVYNNIERYREILAKEIL